MKQKGDIWTDPDGAQVPKKYLAKGVTALEGITGQLTTLADTLEKQVKEARIEIEKLVAEALHLMNTNPDLEGPNGKKTFTFSSFDEEYKFFVNIELNYIHFFRRVEGGKYIRFSVDFTDVATHIGKDDIQVAAGYSTDVAVVDGPISLGPDQGPMKSVSPDQGPVKSSMKLATPGDEPLFNQTQQ